MGITPESNLFEHFGPAKNGEKKSRTHLPETRGPTSGATKATKAHDWMVSVLGPLSYGRTLGQNTARRHGQRRPTAWRCGGEELPEGSSPESKLSLRHQHCPRQVWVKQPRAAERVPLASQGP